MTELVYTRSGAGPLLLCHPGGPGFSGATLGDLGGLGESFELVILDPRGTGGSPRPADGGYGDEEYVSDLEHLREQLGLETFDLLGHSHGGFVAMAYAAAHPERVRRLVLVATAPRFAAEYDEGITRIWTAGDDPSIAAALAARAQRVAAITGELDFFGPPANDDIVAGVADARSVVLPAAGHFVWFDEPDRFREEVTRFLTT